MQEASKSSKSREGHLRRTYGISTEQYDGLLAKAGGGCHLCGKTPEENGKALAVDHNHKTGEIRGVLCAYCNHRVIGRHVDGDLLRRMAVYVEQTTGWFVPPKKKRRRKTPRKAKP